MHDHPLRLKSIHHVELWVGNARQAAFFYRHGLGFSETAYAGLETGQRDLTQYLLTQGKIRLVLSTPIRPEHPATNHIARHGDGVHDIAFHVEDAERAFREAIRRGAIAADEPRELRDGHGRMVRSAIHTYGDTIHSFVSPIDYAGPFLPGFVAREVRGRDIGLLRIDHIVGNVEHGRMQEWARWYQEVLGFARFVSFDDKDISTEFSALMSVVMADDAQAIKFPINEPAPGRKKSQIEEYLDYYLGPGVQHIALLTSDIAATVGQLRANGLEFLRVPDSYYESLLARIGTIDEPVETLSGLGILVDRDEEGYLLQLFTKPVEDRPTLFFEIIQRKGSRGFGKGNFRALFEAIEREQALRGNL